MIFLMLNNFYLKKKYYLCRKKKNMEVKVIKCSSYTEKLPINNCNIKVAVKNDEWCKNDTIKTEVFPNAIYNSGFVSIDSGKNFYLAGNFLFHKLKRKIVK